MTPDQIRGAREKLGHMWGLNRPLRLAELGRALRFTGRDPGRYVAEYEAGNAKPPGPVTVAIDAMLAGYRPKL